MPQRFDLIVIGTGTAASPVATKCREAGWSVAVVDARPYGGTCALRGCDPKRVLLAAAEAVEAARRLGGKGVRGAACVDWPRLMAFKRSFTEPVPGSREHGFTDAGIVTFHGAARFVAPTAVEVIGDRLEARHVHVATGARPADLDVEGAGLLTTSDVFLETDALPRRVVFVGGGYIAFELGHLAAVAGSRVTLLEMSDRPLARFDPDLVSLLAERTCAMGIDLRVSTRAEAIERTGRGLLVRATSGSGPLTLEADMVVHAAGRVPAVAGLDLEAAGIEHDAGGILVNEYMQSVSNPAAYAAGDVAGGGLPLTPVGTFEAHVAASNLLQGNHRRAEYPPIPSDVFTLPPLASVGLGEAEARERGLRFETHHARTSGWYSSRRLGESASGYKVLVEEGSGRILGAHLLGPRAEELVNLFALAMRSGLTSRDLKTSLFAYPTVGSDMAHMV